MDAVALGRLVVDFYPRERGAALRNVSTFKKLCGGGPANFATGLSRLGLRSAMVSVVGRDEFGCFLVDFLRSEGVDVGGVVFSTRTRTSLSFCGPVTRGNFPFLQYGEPGPNLELTPEQVDPKRIAGARVLFVSGVGFSRSPSREASFHALECARQHRVIGVFDLNYRKGFWPSRKEVARHYEAAVRLSDIVLGTTDEVKYVTGESTIEGAVKRLLGLGPRVVCVKAGAKGSTVMTKAGGVEIPAFRTTVLDTTGAGDAYDAGFVYGVLKGWNDRRSGAFASAVAAIVVSREGAAPAMPTLEEVQEFLSCQGGLPEGRS